MPQIEQLAETYTSQIFWLLVFFGLVFFVVGRGMVPRVMDTVALRDTQISGDLAAAQAARDEADRQEAAWRDQENARRAQARALIAEAKAKAAAESATRLVAAQQRIDAELNEAETRIAASRDRAGAQIEAIAGEAVQDVVRRLAGIEVDAASARAAAREAMNHG